MKVISPSTVGIELEVSLIDQRGFLNNVADKILNDHRNDGSLVYENSNARIEVISAPCATIRDLYSDFLPRLNLLDDISKDYMSEVVSVSEFGAGAGVQVHSPRLDVYPRIIGEKGTELIRSIAGLHAHITQTPGRQLGQYWLFMALDPLSYALTSTSPISFEGATLVNCHRIRLMRERISREFPLHAALKHYPRTLREIELRAYARFEQWKKLSGVDYSTFESLFNPGNTGFVPIRKRDGIGPTGTLEIRGFDTCPIEYAMAAVGLFKGCNDRIVRDQIPVTISTRDQFY
ncbi:MAG: hypothetical protein KDD53_04050, partial [Bdellovibrionales bacterium]|nr:hypothetical protein [Bdellovibrionales bacterium]